MSPLGSVHEGRENATGSKLVAKDVKGIQAVPVVLVHAPIRGDAQVGAHGGPKPCHAQVAGLHGGTFAATVVTSWAGQVPQTACWKGDSLDTQGREIGRVKYAVAVAKQTSKGP